MTVGVSCDKFVKLQQASLLVCCLSSDVVNLAEPLLSLCLIVKYRPARLLVSNALLAKKTRSRRHCSQSCRDPSSAVTKCKIIACCICHLAPCQSTLGSELLHQHNALPFEVHCHYVAAIVPQSYASTLMRTTQSHLPDLVTAIMSQSFSC